MLGFTTSQDEHGRERVCAKPAWRRYAARTMKGQDDTNIEALLRCTILADCSDAVHEYAGTKPSVVRQRGKPRHPRYGDNRRTQEKIGGCEQYRRRGSSIEAAPANLPVDYAFGNGAAVFRS